MADVLRLVSPAWKVCRRFCHSFFLQRTSNAKHLFFFSRNPVVVSGPHSAQVQDASSHLLALNQGYDKVST